MEWAKSPRTRAGGYWRCPVKRREAQERYRASRRGKAKVAQYNASPEGKAGKRRYRVTAAGKAADARYRASPKGRARRRRYLDSPKGREALTRGEYARGRRALRARIEAKRERIAALEKELSEART